MTVFNNINLKEQVTESLKDKWYYRDYADRLVVEEERVIFDEDFIYTLKEHSYEFEFDGEIDKEEFITIELNGERMEDYEDIGYFGNGKYHDSTSDILEGICLHIANYI